MARLCLILLITFLALATETSAAQQATRRAAPAKQTSAGTVSPARRWLQEMSLAQKAAQLNVIPFYGGSPNTKSKAYREFVALVRDVQVGGLLILNRVQNGAAIKPEPHAMAAFLNRMQRLSKVPLIIGGDFERGASMRVTSTPEYPHAMAFGAAGDFGATTALGRATAREARAVGVHWVFAPVADVNNNPDNPVINIRSFGEDPQLVARHVRAFIEGAHADPKRRILVTAKHFPGHGDTATDTHAGMAEVSAGRARLERLELFPFKAAIEAGVDAIMTSHVTVPALEPDPVPATVSRRILTGLLRDEMRFSGLIATDALDMQALSKQFPAGEAAVRALEAGADILLASPNPREAVRAVVAAVQSGRISRARLDQSVEKVLAAKARLGLHRERLVNLEEIEDLIDTPEDQELAQSVADRAISQVKNEATLVPLKNPGSACFLVMSGSRYSGTGRQFIETLRESVPAARVFHLDPQLPEAHLLGVASGLGNCETIVAGVYVMASPLRAIDTLPDGYAAFMAKLLAWNKPMVLIALGNPYLLRGYPQVQAYLTTFSTVPAAEIAAVKVLLGAAPAQGKPPVTIAAQEPRQ